MNSREQMKSRGLYRPENEHDNCGVGFIAAMIDDLRDDYEIDPNRVFATGISNGGHMAFRLACELADQIVAVAPVTANMPVDIADDTYSGIISTGTFTHGHLGPEALAEVVRMATPTAVCAIGVNAHHYVEHGFDRWFAEAAEAGLITVPDIVSVAIYEALDGEHAGTRSNVAMFQVRR